MTSVRSSLTSVAADSKLGRYAILKLIGPEGRRLIQVCKEIIVYLYGRPQAKQLKAKFLKLAAKFRILAEGKEFAEGNKLEKVIAIKDEAMFLGVQCYNLVKFACLPIDDDKYSRYIQVSSAAETGEGKEHDHKQDASSKETDITGTELLRAKERTRRSAPTIRPTSIYTKTISARFCQLSAEVVELVASIFSEKNLDYLIEFTAFVGEPGFLHQVINNYSAPAMTQFRMRLMQSLKECTPLAIDALRDNQDPNTNSGLMTCSDWSDLSDLLESSSEEEEQEQTQGQEGKKKPIRQARLRKQIQKEKRRLEREARKLERERLEQEAQKDLSCLIQNYDSDHTLDQYQSDSATDDL